MTPGVDINADEEMDMHRLAEQMQSHREARLDSSPPPYFTCYRDHDRVETGPYFVPALPQCLVILIMIELRQGLTSYQDYHNVLLS